MRRSIILHSRGFADGQDVDPVWAVWLSVPNRTSEQLFIPQLCFVISDGYNDIKFTCVVMSSHYKKNQTNTECFNE